MTEICVPDASLIADVINVCATMCVPGVEDMLDMKVTTVWKIADRVGVVDQATMKNILDQLREAFFDFVSSLQCQCVM